LSKESKSNPHIGIVNCPDPAPYEIADFIKFQARILGLSLDPSAIKLTVDYLGRDLSLVANELRRVALVVGDTPGTLNAKQIAPHLGLLKEEMVYRLRNYVLERRFSIAQALLTDLLDRGESALALLGFLAKHIRTSI